ncbi:MAG: hypothetical protein IT461_10060 [Planctomycetes bacterium]|jgi:hypothetical protein|nr:hypothetical protein [Planctomycetota bacterium]
MTRLLVILALGSLLACACTGGSSTTLRPAADRPIIGPDGVFWDAIEAARGGHTQRMGRVLSTGFVHRAILPNTPRAEFSDEESFIFANERMERELAPFNSIRERLCKRYTGWLDETTRGRVIEAGRPSYEIKYKDGYGSARGPNTATIKVNLHQAQAKTPKVLAVSFIQDGDTWRIDGFSPDPLFGEFIR